MATYLGSFVLLCLGREEYCKQISLLCVWSAHSVWTTVGLPLLTEACAFWVYSAQAPGCSAGVLSKVDPKFCALPRSKAAQVQFLKYSAKAQTQLGVCLVSFPGLSSSGDQVLHKCTVPGGLGFLITSLVVATPFPGCTVRAPSQLCHMSPLRS